MSFRSVDAACGLVVLAGAAGAVALTAAFLPISPETEALRSYRSQPLLFVQPDPPIVLAPGHHGTVTIFPPTSAYRFVPSIETRERAIAYRGDLRAREMLLEMERAQTEARRR